MSTWHTKSVEATLRELDTSPVGLSTQQAIERLAKFGPNELERKKGKSPVLIFLSQFTEIMVIVLLIAAAISFAVGEMADAIMILIIVILNAILGFTQEYRAERAMEALQRLAVPRVHAFRDGKLQEIESISLVPGDIVILEAGLRVPADARLIESANLRAEEAALTGESVPVDKSIAKVEDEGAALGDRTNLVYAGTTIVYGRGQAVIVETGMSTELGNIATMLQEVTGERTPLQKRMAELGKWLAIGALAICALVFLEGLLQGNPVEEMLLTAISLAVAAVPEGLPAVVTIALALGAQRMVRRQALIRKLPAVETLGSVTTICSDKTGTLTQNRMTVTALDIAGDSISFDQLLKKSQPSIRVNGIGKIIAESDFALLLGAASLCNDARLELDENGDGDRYIAIGDPTEGALVVAAASIGLDKTGIEKQMPRVAEVPFTSERKRMTTVHKLPPAENSDGAAAGLIELFPRAPYVAFAKGSVTELLSVCDRVWANGSIEPLTKEWGWRIEVANDNLAKDGMRVLGAAFAPLDELPKEQSEETLERNLIFVGMTGMIDPPRPEVKEAVVECKRAGIRPVMITGDHPFTALHIAKQLGILSGDDTQQVITGVQLSEMSVEELESIVEHVSVYARVSPEHKVKLVEALKDKGHFVAMTGDGVNDAPALKRADIGIAMGITGTDVSKEAADMVLLDDNFATIVNAIEEGRTIYENIRRFVRYIISSNVGEIFIMMMAPLLGFGIPLTALQLLWINLITDGLPALALGVEPTSADVMDRPPHKPDESVMARGLGTYIIVIGLLLGSVCMLALHLGYNVLSDQNHAIAQTMVFTTLCLSQLGNALAVRSETKTLGQLGLFSNPSMVLAVISGFLVQLAVIYVPFLQNLFHTTALTLEQFGVSLALSLIIFISVETFKFFKNRKRVEPAQEAA